MCQKAFGDFFSAIVGVPLTDLEWTRGAPSSFRSSELVERGFCANCGTPLFFKHDENKHISISIAAFDKPETIPLAFQLGMEGRLPQVEQLAGLMDYGATEDGDDEDKAWAAAIKVTNRQHPDHDTDNWPV